VKINMCIESFVTVGLYTLLSY